MKISRLSFPSLRKDVEPAIIIRLTEWQIKPEEIEPDYIRKGYGWREGMSANELYDSTRAWWDIDPEKVVARGVAHAIASHATLIRAVYRIDGWNDRRDDGRFSFYGEEVKSGPIYDDYFGYKGRIIKFKTGDRNALSFWPPKE